MSALSRKAEAAARALDDAGWAIEGRGLSGLRRALAHHKAAGGDSEELAGLWPRVIELRSEAAVEIMAQAGAPLGEGRGRNSPLAMAMLRPCLVSFFALLKAGADPNGRLQGDSLLQRSLSRGESEMAVALIEAGADPNAKDEDGYWALYEAANFGDAKALAALLERGANPLARSPDGRESGRTALERAASLGRKECVEILERACALEEARLIAEAAGAGREGRARLSL